MLAPRELPPQYARWNRAQRLGLALSVFGVALRRSGLARAIAASPSAARMFGPFMWQPSNPARKYEYPWAFHTIKSLGSNLRIVEVGGGLAGMQWVLGSDGHEVVNVDPGLAAAGKGWNVPPAMHQRLSRAFGGDVQLRATTIGAAELADESVDVLLSISTLEHLTLDDVQEFCRHARRVIRRDGVAVLTIDLFLDLEPFTTSTSNRYGRNLDVRRLLTDSGLELVTGTPSELLGFPEFVPDAVQANVRNYTRGRYPALSQCVVARPRTSP